jgi:hypothetical protein
MLRYYTHVSHNIAPQSPYILKQTPPRIEAMYDPKFIRMPVDGIAGLREMDAPPAYTPTQVPPPPTSTVPTRFTIGQSLTDGPLVSIPEIKAHLALLHAFAELKNSVDAVKVPIVLNVPQDQEKRWAWFVGCAVERCVNFEMFFKSPISLFRLVLISGVKHCNQRISLLKPRQLCPRWTLSW